MLLITAVSLLLRWSQTSDVTKVQVNVLLKQDFVTLKEITHSWSYKWKAEFTHLCSVEYRVVSCLVWYDQYLIANVARYCCVTSIIESVCWLYGSSLLVLLYLTWSCDCHMWPQLHSLQWLHIIPSIASHNFRSIQPVWVYTAFKVSFNTLSYI